jgi:hypothetical protein
VFIVSISVFHPTMQPPAKGIGGRSPQVQVNEIAKRCKHVFVARQLHAMHYPLLDFGPYEQEDGSFFLGLQCLQVGKEPDIEPGIPVKQGHWLGLNANPPTSHHVDLGLTGVCHLPVQL